MSSLQLLESLFSRLAFQVGGAAGPSSLRPSLASASMHVERSYATQANLLANLKPSAGSFKKVRWSAAATQESCRLSVSISDLIIYSEHESGEVLHLGMAVHQEEGTRVRSQGLVVVCELASLVVKLR